MKWIAAIARFLISFFNYMGAPGRLEIQGKKLEIKRKKKEARAQAAAERITDRAAKRKKRRQ